MCLGWTVGAFNLLAQWHGLKPDEEGIVHLSITEFQLVVQLAPKVLGLFVGKL